MSQAADGAYHIREAHRRRYGSRRTRPAKHKGTKKEEQAERERERENARRRMQEGNRQKGINPDHHHTRTTKLSGRGRAGKGVCKGGGVP